MTTNISITEWKDPQRYEYTFQIAASHDEVRDALSLAVTGWRLHTMLPIPGGYALIFERPVENTEGESDESGN